MSDDRSAAPSSTRDHLLDVGNELFLAHGFGSTGLAEILRTAGVPKGSFYHHFASKEDFALRVIERYAEGGLAMLDRHLGGEGDDGPPHLERLRGFYEGMIRQLTEGECRGGCLMGTLGHELANVNEPIRERIDELFDAWVQRFAACLGRARDAGELPADTDPDALASFLFLAWEGALQQMKIRRSPEPLQTFVDTTFGQLLAPR